MSESHFVRAVARAMESEGINQSELAARCKVIPSYISRLLAGVRPEDDFFRRVCTSWTQPDNARNVVIAHAIDEILRAGHDPANYVVRPKGDNDAGSDPTLELLRREADADENVRRMLDEFAAVILSRRRKRTKD